MKYAAIIFGLLLNEPYPLQNWSFGVHHNLGYDER